MNILVCPSVMEIGGSQYNAIELAAGVAQAGHSVVMFGPRGELVDTARAHGIDYVFSPVEHSWPSWQNIAALRRLIAERRIDLAHGYEWGPVTDLAFGPHLLDNLPLVATVFSMSVPEGIPRHVPLLLISQRLVAQEAGIRRRVELFEAPVDTSLNTPSRDPQKHRAGFGFDSEDLVVAVVGRLVPDLGKLDGVLALISASRRLAPHYPVRMLVVGGGSGLAAVRRLAAEVNGEFGRDVVVVAGPLIDPRPAYSAADVVVGMGTSVLRGMCYEKPVIVQGLNGFCLPLNESTIGHFLDEGWHGVGGSGPTALVFALEPLLLDKTCRRRLGVFGRKIVEERFSVEAAVARLIGIYESAIRDRTLRRHQVLPIVHAAGQLAKFKMAQRFPRLRTNWRRLTRADARQPGRA